VGKAIIICAVIVCVALVLVTMIVVGHRLVNGPGVRRRELRVAETHRDDLRDALDKVEAYATQFSDVDSIVSAEVRKIIREYEHQRRSR
jgi:hypothetical protein